MRKVLTVTVVLLGLVSGAIRAVPHASAEARNGKTQSASRAATADPCGYRYAVWTTVQQVQNYAQFVESTGASDMTVVIPRFSYLRFKVIQLANDYGQPAGWHKIQDAEYDVAQAALNNKSLNKSLTAMWSAVGSICAWKGKAATSPGILNAYGDQTTDTKNFRVRKNWHVSVAFDCNDSPGSFMLALHSVGGQQVDVTEDRIRTTSSDGYTYKRGGSFYFRVISDCNWHVNVRQ